MAESAYLLAAASLLLVFYYFQRRSTKNFPPGPKGAFLVGNLSAFQLKGEQKGKTYVKWFEEYGNIMHLEVFGNHMIVLNSAQATIDLMDKRAAIYSDRPRFPMVCELVGNDWVFSVMSGEPHKERRALAQRYFVAQLKDWQLVQVESARTLIRNLSNNLSDWEALIRLNVASSILRIAYGYEVTRTDDALLKLVQEVVGSPRNGPYLVDLFPLLKYYPSWLPGGQFHKDAEAAKIVSQQFRHMPFDMVRNEMALGIASPSFISTLLTQLPPDEDQKSLHQAALIRDTAATLYGAAMDTTLSSLFMFLGIMVLHPDVQHRAQNELDTVLGKDQLPTFEDRTLLPFIDALVLEVFRWNVVTPLGFPHMVTEDDEYLSYQIPKGATVFGNMWAILRDPAAFPNPETFDPSRFLAETEGSATARKVLESTVYGWGRRTCPGRHVGYSGVFIMISYILSCFEICKSIDDAGNGVDLVLEYEDKFIARWALPPNCSIKTRRPDRIAILDMSAPKSSEHAT